MPEKDILYIKIAYKEVTITIVCLLIYELKHIIYLDISMKIDVIKYYKIATVICYKFVFYFMNSYV